MLKLAVALVAAVLATASLATAADPTSPFFAPAASGTSVTVAQATLQGFAQFYSGALTGDTAKTVKNMVTPYVYTAAELAALEDQYILVKLAEGAKAYNMVYNFTQSEGATIKTWLQSLPVRNNMVVSFASTWSSSGRIVIDTASWVLDNSLMPYGQTADCDPTKALLCLAQLQTQIPLDCINTGIPLLKKCIVDNQNCLLHSAKGLNLVGGFCATNRQAIDTLFCSDGRVGGDEVCDFIKCVLPDGKPLAAPVVTTDADGIPTAGGACAGSSAGAVLASAVLALLALVCAMML